MTKISYYMYGVKCAAVSFNASIWSCFFIVKNTQLDDTIYVGMLTSNAKSLSFEILYY